MTFPVRFTFGPVSVPAHLVFESLAYFTGFQAYRVLRRRWGDPVSGQNRWTVIAAAAVGAVLGSKVLVWVQHADWVWSHRGEPAAWLGGKTIVGGLLGGLIAVEATKTRIGEHRSTGDLFALPLCVGIALGRVGCFLAGLPDHTHGNPTSLPWGVDFGDGIRRHPAQLYEIIALGLIALWIEARRGDPARVDGDLFRGFMIFYLAFRFGLEFLKPEPHPYLGLSGIQIACLAGLFYYAPHVRRLVLHGGHHD